jgi:hypothetical protein
MSTRELINHRRGYILAGLLGAVGGGLIILLGTNALPKMFSKMMQNMMSNMGNGECSPAEM